MTALLGRIRPRHGLRREIKALSMYINSLFDLTPCGGLKKRGEHTRFNLVIEEIVYCQSPSR